eukprot:TRINITY_DN350_c0_g2_i1.p1 TRINITY_DN350_c0_g2~~TRINITY_DN350_c0_g2_i1.p1  ORF type:complete len:243 (+),score=40.04 TRINITY_DN350_c0_g2_i1:37-765(+)
MANFSEKYGDIVRVVDIPGHSTELCGGTHVQNTVDLQFFKIAQEVSASLGVRRIVAVTGAAAFSWLDQQKTLLDRICASVGAPSYAKVAERVDKICLENATLKKKIAALEENAHIHIQTTNVGPYDRGNQSCNVILHMVEGREASETNDSTLRKLGDQYRTEQPESVHFLVAGPKVHCIVAPERSGVYANAILTDLFAVAQGRGGGSQHLAQGYFQLESSENPEQISSDALLPLLRQWLSPS